MHTDLNHPFPQFELAADPDFLPQYPAAADERTPRVLPAGGRSLLPIIRGAAVLLGLVLSATFGTAAPHADLQAIRSYKSAAIENACVIESLAFTAWLRENYPQHPSRVVYFPTKSGGHHAVALFTLDREAYLWDMDFGPLNLQVKTDSLELPSLTQRASDVFHRTLSRSTVPDVELTMLGGVRPWKIKRKIRPPTDVPLAQWVYQRIVPVVPDATLVTYRHRQYVVFVRDLAAHVFSAERGTLVAIAPSEHETLSAIRWLLSDTYGGDGNYVVVAGPSDKAIARAGEVRTNGSPVIITSAGGRTVIDADSCYLDTPTVPKGA